MEKQISDIMHTPITYYGGKQQLASKIISMIPKHKIYCEPFFGGGAVFFAKGKSFLEVINDTNNLLINFYQQCIENFDALQFKIQHTLYSEALFNEAKGIYNHPKYHTKVDKAWALWVMTNMSIMATPVGGWKRDNGTGGSHIGVTLNSHRNKFTKAIHERLCNVQISCHDAIQVIRERDTPNTFFYCDQPYVGADQKHYRGYSKSDFENLLITLADIKGRFILSNFNSRILQSYIKNNDWNQESISREVMIPHYAHKSRKKTEMLVWNYDIERSLFDL